MHDEIKKFSLGGFLGEPNVVATKERMIHFVENMMRDYGYVPSLDNEPQFTLDYNGEQEGFDFELSIYGVPVGKEQAWQISGMTSGKPIPKSTPKTK